MYILNLTASLQNGLTVDSGMIMKIGGVGSVETQITLFKYILHGVIVYWVLQVVSIRRFATSR
jgi:hypothetical protein